MRQNKVSKIRLETTTFAPLDEDHNDLIKRIRLYREACATVAAGYQRLLICYGVPGLGKTHIAEEVLKKQRVRIRQLSPGSPQGFVKMLGHMRPNTVGIADDKDFIFRSERLMNILKIVADPRGKRIILPHDLIQGEQPVEVFCRGIIILSNLDFDDPKTFKSDIRDHIEALKSRARGAIHKLSFDRKECYDYTISIARKMARDNNIRFPIATEALEFFADNVWRLPEISPRMLLAIIRVRQLHPKSWKEHLEIDIPDTDDDRPTPRPMVLIPKKPELLQLPAPVIALPARY